MSEPRYPGLANGQPTSDGRDSFTTRYAEQGGGSGGNGANGSANGNASRPPEATQAESRPSPSGPSSNGYGVPAADLELDPKQFEGFDLSKIGGTSTYGSGSGSSPASGPPAAPPPGPPPSQDSPTTYQSSSSYSPPPTGYSSSGYGVPAAGPDAMTGYSSSGYGVPAAPPESPATYKVSRDGRVKKVGVDTGIMPPVPGGPAPGGMGAPPGGPGLSSSARPSTAGSGQRGPRRARLQLKHIDPWSMMKFSLVLSIALFVIWMIAVGILYGVLSGMGVFAQINDLYGEVAGGQLVTPTFVLGSAAVVGAVNIVLFTALATVGSFVYNLCSDLVGGVEVTLAERD